MSKTAERNKRRNYRQNQRRSEITSDQMKAHPTACEQYIIFGHKQRRPLDGFIKEFIKA